MKYQHLLSLLCILLSQDSFSQNAEFNGKVLGASNESLVGAAVILTDSEGVETATQTDHNGNFSISHLVPGNYEIKLNYFGQDMDIKGQLELSYNEVEYMELTFDPGYTLDTFTIRPNLVVVSPDVPIVTFDAKDIELSGLKDLGDLLARAPKAGQSREGGDLHIAGARGNASVMFVDGTVFLDMANPLPTQAIQTVALYSGGVSAKYGDSVGGFVVVKSKAYRFEW